MIELDGSEGEGGGQILRTSLALSLITEQPFHLQNIRAGRAKPGLQPQHLTCVTAAAAIGQAVVDGAGIHSTDLVFEPGPVTAGKYHFSVGTAGAVSLVLHTLYLPLALRGQAESQLMIEGGTHVNASPCFHFLDTTWREYLKQLGLTLDLKLRRPGFYPRGGGIMDAQCHPGIPRGIDLMDRGSVREISVLSAVASLPEEIAIRQGRRAADRLKRTRLKVRVEHETWAGGPGTVLAIIIHTTPVPTMFFGIGARGKPAERVADEAADQALAFLDAAPAAVDPHSADQLLLPCALAKSPSRFTVTEVTSHLLTNKDVIRRFIDRDIECTGEIGEPGVVTVA
jgi:RNA 3'-terminal phosphate cyclase (ATP)